MKKAKMVSFMLHVFCHDKNQLLNKIINVEMKS